MYMLMMGPDQMKYLTADRILSYHGYPGKQLSAMLYHVPRHTFLPSITPKIYLGDRVPNI